MLELDARPFRIDLAEAIPALMAMDPVEIDFGAVLKGATATRQIKLTNRSSAPITLTGGPAIAPPFYVRGLGSSTETITLDPFGIHNFDVDFKPTTAQETSANRSVGWHH